MSAHIFSPTLFDVTSIPTSLADLVTLSKLAATGMVGFFLILELLNQNVLAIEGRSRFTNSFVRLFLIFLCLLTYQKIFQMLMDGKTALEWTVLNENDWADLLATLKNFMGEKIDIFSSLSFVVTWVGSFIAIDTTEILGWVQYCFLSLLYFVGPLFFAAAVFKPLSYLVGSWFRAVIQISLWTFFVRVVMRVLLAVEITKYLKDGYTNNDFLKTSAIF